MGVRLAKEQDRIGIFNGMWYCFPEPKEWHDYEEETFDPHNFIVCESDKGKINASLKICDFQMFYEQEEVSIGGIAAVASRPDERYKGHIGQLLKFTLKEMKDRGIVFSPLAPFLYEFYAKYGWAISYDRYKYELDVNLLEGLKDDSYSYEYQDESDATVIQQVADEYYSQYTGAIVHGDKFVKEKSDLIERFGYMMAVVRKAGKVVGFIVYKRDKDILDVDELVGVDMDAYKALLHYIYMHNASVETVKLVLPQGHLARYLFKEPSVNVKFCSDMMMRIVDVQKALELRKYDSGVNENLYIKVIDERALWNNGIWKITVEQGRISATRDEQSNCQVEVSIASLSQMVMGYLSIDEIDMLHGLTICDGIEKEKVMTSMRILFEKRRTYMNERF